MLNIRQWINRKLKSSKKPLSKLFFTGLKGNIQIKAYKPYNFYLKMISITATIGFILYFLQIRKTEMDRRGYNLLIPDYVYRVREENYIYWETVRIAKGMPTTFTYYRWDDNLMFQVDRTGKQTPLQMHKGIENPATFNSPLHQYNFPASPETHSKIIMYLKNINNPYNLYNYLRWKPISMGDWLRSLYYGVYRELGLSNRWRYDQYVTKPDIYYRFQKLRIAFRLSRNREELYNTLDKLMKEITWDHIAQYFIWFI